MKKLIALLAFAAAPVLFAQEKPTTANAAELRPAGTTQVEAKAPATQKATAVKKAEVQRSQQEVDAKKRELQKAEVQKQKATEQSSKASLKSSAAAKK